jgi:hypothetical protein
MRSLSVSFPDPKGRYLGAFEEMRRDFHSFPEKFFSITPPPHNKKNE